MGKGEKALFSSRHLKRLSGWLVDERSGPTNGQTHKKEDKTRGRKIENPPISFYSNADVARKGEKHGEKGAEMFSPCLVSLYVFFRFFPRRNFPLF